ncbi:glutathione S-transferase C-terminal-like protein [Dacryopinax primogenitus]|uniref:Glutathione S-transferase C-terminal-like protein n=1 Tax=Dacryopinax primogenitus (strain DJM 731) TaxID=1858805 RepID=M5G9R5_DACPD|nr:glutathione S-transferase C-terminal-like protein [Dacryopinax primogenitus]EJU05030.1 glutathione S-transferase C-terminal-like protein [Dacryopinax primogenitus]
MSSPPHKLQKLAPYILHYWGGIPGRGEYVRLAFEYAGVSYTDSNDSAKLLKTLRSTSPSHFAPPMLELPNGKILSQTPAILNYLAPKLGLAGEKGNLLKNAVEDDDEREEAEFERSIVNQLVLTALDLCVEAHDSHHPIASSLYYEDQKQEALRRAEDFLKLRIPKYLAHFEETLRKNKVSHSHLVGKTTTTADLVLFHVVDGLLYAFPRRMGALDKGGKYKRVLKLHEKIMAEGGIKEYVESGRRRKFGVGLFRHYPELDGEDEDTIEPEKE